MVEGDRNLYLVNPGGGGGYDGVCVSGGGGGGGAKVKHNIP